MKENRMIPTEKLSASSRDRHAHLRAGLRQRPGVLPLRAQPPKLRTVPGQTQHASALGGLVAVPLFGRAAFRGRQDCARRLAHL